MKDTKNKTKKWALVACAMLVCGILTGLIYQQFQPPGIVDEPPVSSSEASQPESKSEDELVFVPNPQTPPASSTPESGNGISSAESLRGSTDQTIQPDPVKPEQISPPEEKPEVEDEDTLKNPEQKPEYKPEDKQKPSSTPDDPKNGDTNNGKIYVEGFGWIENHGGGGEGGIADSDGDINKQVGEM